MTQGIAQYRDMRPGEWQALRLAPVSARFRWNASPFLDGQLRLVDEVAPRPPVPPQLVG